MAKAIFHPVYIGLGSNLGNREENLDQAIEIISKPDSNRFLFKSKWMENPAVEDAGPDDFLNGVIKIETKLSPHELLDFLQAVEKEIDPDRENRGRKKARYIDIDILKYGELEINDERLVIPHPRMKEREFVTKPLREIEAKEYAQEMVQDIDSNLSNRISEVPSFIDAKLNDYDSKRSLELADQINKQIENHPKVKLRRMYLEDLDQVYSIDEKIFGEKHWGRDTFLQELENPNAQYLAAVDKKDEKKVLGYGGIWTVIDEMHIMTLGVAEEQRGQKIAETLLLAFLEIALRYDLSSLTLEVRLSNLAAISLYEKFGFYRQGTRPKYYADGEDALILWTENIHGEKFITNLKTKLNSEVKN